MLQPGSRSEGGQTLIEMLIAATVALIVIGAVVDLTVSALHSQTDQTNRLTAQQDARIALDRMRRQIHCGQTASGGGASVTVAMGSACSTTGTITWCVVSTGGGLYTLKSAAVPTTCDLTHGTPLITTVTSATPFTVTQAPAFTTLSANVDSLPASTLPVVSLAGFTAGGTNVLSVGASPTPVTCLNTSGAPAFTNCSGGSGTQYSKGTAVTLSGNQQFTQVGVNLTVRSSARPYKTFRFQDSIDLRNTPQ